jgi:hypothetical protein
VDDVERHCRGRRIHRNVKAPPELSVDPVLVILVCVISTLAGGTSLAIRINNLIMEEDQRARDQGSEPRPFVRPWLFACAHMGGSWMAGLTGLLLGRANEWGVWTLLLGVLLMSFLGAKAIEMLAERFLSGAPLPISPPKK